MSSTCAEIPALDREKGGISERALDRPASHAMSICDPIVRTEVSRIWRKRIGMDPATAEGEREIQIDGCMQVSARRSRFSLFSWQFNRLMPGIAVVARGSLETFPTS